MGFLFALPFVLLVPLLLLATVALGLAVLPQGKVFIQSVLNNPAVQANVGSPTLGGLIGLVARLRLATPWTWLALAALDRLGGWRGVGGFAGIRRYGDAGDTATRSAPCRRVAASRAPDLFAVIMIGLALILTLVPEFMTCAICSARG